MATISVTNEKRMIEISAVGTQVSINGVITVNGNGKVDSVSGNVNYNVGESGDIIIGNFSLTNLNMHADKYAVYRTEASQLIDEAVAYVEANQEGGAA